MQRREKEKLKLQEQQKKEIKKEKKNRSAQDIAIENFAAAAVKDSLKLSLIQMSIEDGVSNLKVRSACVMEIIVQSQNNLSI